MKKTRKIGVSIALFVIVALAARAQSTPPPASDNQEFRLSVGPDFALPIGNIAHAYSGLFLFLNFEFRGISLISLFKH